MARKPSHPRLPDHNARVRRWVKDFDDTTLHPILLVLGYGVDLDDNTYKYNVVAIANGMARYREGMKPVRSTVFAQLAKLEALGIIKNEDQFGPTGRQRITHRIVDFHQAVRFGRPVDHLWDAPLPDETPDRTPSETPGRTPDRTPSLSLTVSELSSTNSFSERDGASPSREIERGPGRARPDKDASGICNTFIAWEVKGSGKKVAFRKDKPPRQKPPKHARVVELSPAEASFMFRCLDRDQWPDFILAKPFERAFRMKMYAERDVRDRAERDNRPTADELARQVEARSAAERAERAPLVARFAELTGKTVEAVRAQVESTGLPHTTMKVGLEAKIFRAELATKNDRNAV